MKQDPIFEIVCIVDNPDGSRTIEMMMNEAAQNFFADIGREDPSTTKYPTKDHTKEDLIEVGILNILRDKMNEKKGELNGKNQETE